MDPSSASDTLSRNVLIDMVKAQLDDDDDDDDSRNAEDFRRDVFLCLAVTIPARQRRRVKSALELLLARARIRGSCRDSELGEDPHDLHGHHRNDFDLAAQLERSIGVISTLLVMGCEFFRDFNQSIILCNFLSSFLFLISVSQQCGKPRLSECPDSDTCDLDAGLPLLVLNHWSIKSSLWTERRLSEHKEISLQLALTMTLGLLHPSDWSGLPSLIPEFLTLAQRVRADYRGLDFTASSQKFYLSWEGLQTRSLQLAGLMAYVLKTGGLEDVPRSDLLPLVRDFPSTTSDRLIIDSLKALPAPAIKLPLLENFSSTGIRAQPDSWHDWYTSRVRSLVNTIQDEEWYGYYVYTLGDNDNPSPGGVQQDPAMENIYFKVGSGPPVPSSRSQASTTTTTTYPSKVPIEAHGGKDGVMAEFDFVGSINTNTGMVNLRKSYRGAHHWDYEGIMTPLGIVGEWGREGTGFDGYFWLWKRSWMVNNAVQRTHGYS